MSRDQHQIGSRLREAREQLGLTQDAVAKRLGVARSAVVRMEQGTRRVTGTELAQLARVYGRDLSDFVGMAPLGDDPFLVLERAAGDNPEHSESVARAIACLKEVVRLTEFLELPRRLPPPVYRFDGPRTIEEAVDQGKEAAAQERRRLGLGTLPLTPLSRIISDQGVWALSAALPESMSGFFAAHERYGLSIFVNRHHPVTRRRFSLAHEYAHALLDRDQPPVPDNGNGPSLREKRANAFASELLLPAGGVVEMLDRLGKGRPAHSESWDVDPVTGDVHRDDLRADSVARRIEPFDVGWIADAFQVSFEMAAIRLKEIGRIRRSDLDRLLERGSEGRDAMRMLGMLDGGESTDGGPDHAMERQLMALAIEAYRRDRISRGRLVSVCALAGVEPDPLLRWVSRGDDE